MKVFLFLYPISEYVTLFLGLDSPAAARFASVSGKSYVSYSIKRYNPRYINSLIEARYRDQGYHIAWLFPGLGLANSAIELSEKSEFIEIRQGDQVLPSYAYPGGYADVGRVLEDLAESSPLEEIILGGYHQWDCVDKFAAGVYEAGISVRVDEDLTEFYFDRMSLQGIPLIRTCSGLSSLKSYALVNRRCATRGKPWFEQI